MDDQNKKIAYNKIRLSLNFENLRFFSIIRELLFVLFNNVLKKKMFTIKIEDGR